MSEELPVKSIYVYNIEVHLLKNLSRLPKPSRLAVALRTENDYG
jgi:hypothetical protein